MTKNGGDLEFIRASSEVLEDFLLSGETYWPLTLPRDVAASTGMSRLSLGALLFVMARIDPGELSAEGRVELTRLTGQIEGLKQRWLSHWRQKAQKEIPGRLTLWSNYLAEISQETRGEAANYTQQVRWRVMLEFLGQESGQAGLTAALDEQLKARFLPGGFVWEASLASLFPEKTFWYLYGRPTR